MNQERLFIIIFAVVTTLLLMLLVAFCLSLIVLYRRKQSIHQKTLQNVKLEHDKLLLEAQLQIQEETFSNISREIHDNISQVISLAKGKIARFAFSLPRQELELVESDELLSEALLDLKDISRSLSSDLVRKNGLIKTLEFEVCRLKQWTTNLEFEVVGYEVQFTPEKELILFRIVQEALSNAIKYANAKNITIEVRYSREEMIIVIKDDGSGFDVEHVQNAINEKSGLLNMRNRTELLNGRFQVASRLGNGTNITINIPTTNTNV